MEISPRAINAVLGMLGVQIQPEQIESVVEMLQTKLPEVAGDFETFKSRCERIEEKLDRLLVLSAAQRTDFQHHMEVIEFEKVNSRG